MGGMLNAIASYNPVGFGLDNQHNEQVVRRDKQINSDAALAADRLKIEQARQDRAAERAERDQSILQGAIAAAHGAKDPARTVDDAIIKGGISPKAYQDWTKSQADIGAHILTQQREKNTLNQALHKEASEAIGGVLAEASPELQIQAYGLIYPKLAKTLDEDELHNLPTPDQFNPAQHGQTLRTIGGALDIAAAQTDRALKVQNEKKAELDATEAQRQADFVAKDPGGLTPQQRATLDEKNADNKRAEAAAKVAEQHHQDSMKMQQRGQDLTRRGQDMTDARSRDAREEKPSTGGEKKALGFYQRAEAAAKDLEELEPEIDKMGTLSTGIMNSAPNVLLSETAQRFNAAARAFTEARLRKDSGAAVPTHEYENDRKTYFPIAGDSPKVKQEKARRRSELLESIRAESGRAYSEYYGGDRPSAANAPTTTPKASAPKTADEYLKGIGH